ncbi:MAG: hypothetical protein NT169_00825 [Chloroflexi bacterium]|nr:hypothetical protein [Chloroflexota bacterium]
MNPSQPSSPIPEPIRPPMGDAGPARLELLLDLLADEVAGRLQARGATQRPIVAEPAEIPIATVAESAIVADVAAEPTPELPAPSEPESEPILAPDAPPIEQDTEARPSHAAVLLARLALGLLVLVVAINIPFNRHGTTLATALPGSASLVIRNGLLVKEADQPGIYVFRSAQFHWISSLDAFDYYGYRWQDVHIVEPGFLAKFELGAPIHVLLKCSASPHIYRRENDRKRWIVDLPTFSAEGHVWEDVKMVSCEYLRSLPDGDSIPPGRGAPPPPLP